MFKCLKRSAVGIGGLETHRSLSLIIIVVALFMVASCLEPRGDDLVDDGDGDRCGNCHEPPDDEVHKSCHRCHGFPVLTGAHRVHVEGGDFGREMTCDTCHVVPLDWFDKGHLNAIVEISFPDRLPVKNGEQDPTWEDNRCWNLYCHGGSSSGGRGSEPGVERAGPRVWRLSRDSTHGRSSHLGGVRGLSQGGLLERRGPEPGKAC